MEVIILIVIVLAALHGVATGFDEAAEDATSIRTNGDVDYLGSNIKRIVGASMFTGVSWILYANVLVNTSPRIAILIFLLGIALMGVHLSSFYLTFEYRLNGKRRLHWWYLGDNKLDQILAGYKNRYYRLGLKILLVMVFIIGAILLNHGIQHS